MKRASLHLLPVLLASLVVASPQRLDSADGLAVSTGRMMRANDFIDAIGVNTHLAWDGPWANAGAVDAAIAMLGVKHLRDSTPYDLPTTEHYTRLAGEGVRFDILLTGGTVNIPADLARLDRLQQRDKRSVAAIEGINEFNVNHSQLAGRDSFNDPAWGAMLDEALFAAVRARPGLANLKVIAASLAGAGPDQVRAQGDLSRFVGFSNWHAYFPKGEQPARLIRSAVAAARATASGRPVILTEAGYYTAVDAMDWGGGGVDEPTQARLTLNLLLDAAEAGAARTYLYALIDNVLHPASTDLEGSFGLFHGDGTPKAAAATLHDLLAFVADAGSEAARFTPAPLPAILRGAAPDDHHLLLARSDGSYVLALWPEPTIWDDAARCPIRPATHRVIVVVGADARIAIHDPVQGATMPTTVASSVAVDLSDRPMLLAIAPVSRQQARESTSRP